MSWRRLEDVFARRLEGVLKMSWKRLEDVFAKRLEDFLARRLENVLKTSWRHMTKTNILVLIKRPWRCLENVFCRRISNISKANVFVLIKTSFEDEDERRLQDVFIKTNVCWVGGVLQKIFPKNFTKLKEKYLCYSLFLRLFKTFRPPSLQLYWRETPVLVFQSQSFVDYLQNRCSWITHKIQRKTPMLEPLFE